MLSYDEMKINELRHKLTSINKDYHVIESIEVGPNFIEALDKYKNDNRINDESSLTSYGPPTFFGYNLKLNLSLDEPFKIITKKKS